MDNIKIINKNLWHVKLIFELIIENNIALQQLANQRKEGQESYSYNAKTNGLLQLYKERAYEERANIIDRRLYLISLLAVLGILILITILNGGLFLSEILSSSFIIICLFILKKQ